MFGVVCIKDMEGTTYVFQKVEETPGVIINGQNKGEGKLITPIHKLTLMAPAVFSLLGKTFKTGPIKGVLVE